MMTDSAVVVFDNFAFGGEAVGKLPDGKTIFVRRAAPKDRALVEITQNKARFCRGEVREILEPAPERITPQCPYFATCPGCSYLHVTYAAELAAKEGQFRRFVTHKNLVDPSVVLPIFPASRRFGYRNRLKLAVETTAEGEKIFGYRGEDNRTLVPISRCALACEEINRYLERGEIQSDTECFLRHTERDGVVEVAPNERRILTESLPEWGEFQVPAASFFQTNPEVATELCRRVVATIKSVGVTKLLELYCGVGVFSLVTTAEISDSRATGVEIDADSIKRAQANAVTRGVTDRCRFIADDAMKFFKRQIKRKANFTDTALLLDPPRHGLDAQLTRALGEISAAPALLIYISCAPDTLRRDLEKLCEFGWRVESCGALDMFPGTAHFESITTLRKTCVSK